jgi:hypothetical protein
MWLNHRARPIVREILSRSFREGSRPILQLVPSRFRADASYSTRTAPFYLNSVSEFYLNKLPDSNEGAPWCAVGEFKGGAVVV